MTSIARSLVCAAALVSSTSFAHAQSAAAPGFSIGDTWTRKNRDTSYTISVVKIEDGGTWFTGGIPNCGGCLAYYDNNLTLLKLTRADGTAVDVTQLGFVPLGSEWRFFDFPLTLNKKWSLDATGYWKGGTARYQADNV